MAQPLDIQNLRFDLQQSQDQRTIYLQALLVYIQSLEARLVALESA